MNGFLHRCDGTAYVKKVMKKKMSFFSSQMEADISQTEIIRTLQIQLENAREDLRAKVEISAFFVSSTSFGRAASWSKADLF